MEKINNKKDKNFDNRLFWNERYLNNPNLGSGIGSRGDNLMNKRAILKEYFKVINPLSILDVGCGDFTVLSEVTIGTSYHGVDISNEIIRINNCKYPGRKFTYVNFGDLNCIREYESDVVL